MPDGLALEAGDGAGRDIAGDRLPARIGPQIEIGPAPQGLLNQGCVERVGAPGVVDRLEARHLQLYLGGRASVGLGLGRHVNIGQQRARHRREQGQEQQGQPERGPPDE